jgi:hypothetical protein
LAFLSRLTLLCLVSFLLGVTCKESERARVWLRSRGNVTHAASRKKPDQTQNKAGWKSEISIPVLPFPSGKGANRRQQQRQANDFPSVSSESGYILAARCRLFFHLLPQTLKKSATHLKCALSILVLIMQRLRRCFLWRDILIYIEVLRRPVRLSEGNLCSQVDKRLLFAMSMSNYSRNDGSEAGSGAGTSISAPSESDRRWSLNQHTPPIAKAIRPVSDS